MVTDKDENESREGNSSSQDGNGERLLKKKRLRVGEVRAPQSSSNYGSRERYSSSEENRGSYGNSERVERNSYSNNYGGSSERSLYNSERSYNSNSGSGERSYNSNGNRGGYSNDRRPAYNNDRRQGGGNRPYNNAKPKQRKYVDPDQKVIERAKRLVKPVKYKENLDPSTPLRLNKYLANAGVCSRREADAHIAAGEIKVNGVVVSELGAKVTRGDTVSYLDKVVSLESKVYVLLNKPKNCVTTSDDPQNRKTVMDLVKNACPERIYPVGRLDRNTTGVLLLTNDGDLASKLMHPKFKKKKIYQVTLDRDVEIDDMQAIADGIMLDDGEIHADSIAYVAEDILNEVGIEIHSGRNRVVRRIFEKLGYQVTKLDRVYFSGLTKKNLPRGRWRYLTETEVNMLRMGSFE